MSIIVKGLVLILFFSIVVGLISLLPSTADYPLPTPFAVSLTVVLGYYFAWAKVFWFLSVLWFVFFITIALEALIWMGKKVLQAIGWASTILA